MRVFIAALLAIQSWLIVPSIGLVEPIGYVPIVNRSYNTSELENGVGQLADTGWGDRSYGRLVIAGHTPGALDRLLELREGDQIIWMPEHGEALVFEVTHMFLATPENTLILTEDAPEWLERELVLITCYEDKRLIVRARQVED